MGTQSIIQEKRECFVCGRTDGLQLHHCFYGTSNRKWADRYGLVVWLCLKHHTGSNYCVHQNIALDLEVKKDGQRAYESKIGSREEFVNTFGRNYLWKEEMDETARKTENRTTIRTR